MIKRKLTILSALCLTASFSTQASLIINEVDYDQLGTDTAEFIELYNTGTSSLSLDGFALDLINGNTGSAYRNIDLSGFSVAASDYFVVCNANGTVANCDFAFTSSSSWLQNGAPDGIALYDNNTLIDSMTYEGEIVGFTEGSTLFLEDSNGLSMSLGRIPDGLDTDNNFSDFQSNCITPGSSNISGTGDCSALAVNAVPVPAAVWLFASGLLGLVSVGRRMS